MCHVSCDMCLCNILVTPSGVRGFLGVVSQPGTLSHIEMGWVWLPGPGGGRRDVSIRTIASICPGGEQGTKEAVQECQLEPWHLGEAGTDPGDYGFRFRAGGRWFNVQVVLVLVIPWYCSFHAPFHPGGGAGQGPGILWRGVGV